MTQFSDTTNRQGLFQDAQDLVGVDSNRFTIEQFTRWANDYLHEAAIEIWHSQDDWDFDDSNHTDFPEATATLVDGQQDYALPADALRIKTISVKDNGGDWHLLRRFDEEIIGQDLAEFFEDDALPQFYRLSKQSVFLHPAPASESVTTTNGLKIQFLREVKEFTINDTTEEPGIPRPFHKLISLGPAYEFARSNPEVGNAEQLKRDYRELLRKMQTHFSSRHEQERRIKPRKENYE